MKKADRNAKLFEKIAAMQFKEGELLEEKVLVKLHSAKGWKESMHEYVNFDDKQAAKFLADQLFDIKTEEPIFTAKFILSDKCPNILAEQIMQLCISVNTGMDFQKKS